MKIIMVHVMCAFFIFAPITINAEENISKVFPKENEIDGWSMDGDEYVAKDDTALMRYINGAAPFYIKNGTIQACFREYSKEDKLLNAEIYKQSSTPAAKILYAEIGLMGSKPIKNLKANARYSDKLIGSTVLEMQTRQYFVRLTIDGQSAEAFETLMAFAKIIVRNITGT